MFGTGFLSRFEASQCPSKLLEEITLVDTPGVLSGEKQRVERQYDFIGVWKGCILWAVLCPGKIVGLESIAMPTVSAAAEPFILSLRFINNKALIFAGV